MGSPLPREPSGHSLLHEWCRKALRCIRERTILPSTDYSIEESPAGVRLKFKQKAVSGGGGGKFKYRGMWEPFQEYKENDVVIIRAGQATEGRADYNHGTFFCVLDHVAGPENMPKEPTFNQADTSLDPLESTGPTDIWRTLAQGTWNDFVVAPFPGDLPDALIPFNYVHLYPGNVQVASGTPTASAGASLAGGRATGSGGGTSWTLDVSDLPPGESVKFRLMQWCEDNEEYTAYFPCTAKKKVNP